MEDRSTHPTSSLRVRGPSSETASNTSEELAETVRISPEILERLRASAEGPEASIEPTPKPAEPAWFLGVALLALVAAAVFFLV